MSSTNPGAAVTTQYPQQAAIGNLSNEWVILLTPGLTTTITQNSSVEISVTVPGLQLYDFVEANKLNHVAGLSIGNARVSAANTLALQMVNSTGVGINLQAGDQYLVSIERPIAMQAANGIQSSIPA